MIPKEFQRSNLALELKAGKERLELVLHGLTDEQCRMAGAVRSDSVAELVSHLIRNEFLALNKACERRAGSEEQPSGVEQRSRFAERRRHAGPKRSIESVLAEFEVARSAIIRLVEQGAGNNAHYGTVAEICVTRFNEHIEQIEQWRGSQLVGFSAARLRAEAREAELNQALVDVSREDFLAGNFDLKALFSLLFERFYSEDFVLWLGTEEANGRSAAFQRMAEVLEPFNTLFEMGLAFIESFHATAEVQDAEGNFHRVGNGSRRVICDAHARSLAHGPCLETTGRHRRTNRGPGAGRPARDLKSGATACLNHLQNRPSCGMNLARLISRRSEPDDLEAANASVARI